MNLPVLVAVIVFTTVAPAGENPVYVNAQLPWHPVNLDAQGKLLAWYHPEKSLGYDRFERLAWDFLEHKVPIDKTTGVKVYLTASMYDGKTFQGTNLQHNPAGTFAHQADALVGWYPYSGDEEAITVVRTMLDYQLAHGTTPGDWEWAQVPYATSCLHEKEYGGCLRDMPMDFHSGIETDKVGELGTGYVEFYELTGERRYLEAAIHCANALAKHVRAGDSRHTPWPFRLDARTGATLAGEEYGGMIVAPVRLFEELIRIKAGDTAAWQRAREMAWKWLLENPLNPGSPAFDKWSGYHEDIPKDTVNVNTETAMMTAFYILNRENPAAVDPAWKGHVGYLIDRSRALLGLGPFFGAWAINEQLRPDGALGDQYLAEQEDRDMRGRDPEHKLPNIEGIEVDNRGRDGGALLHTQARGCCSRAGLVCATSQWAAINAMYFVKARDGQAREDAFRSLNYATYFAESDGKINATGDLESGKYWFEDGYGDAGRSFMWAMGTLAEFAPIGENHLLHSSSVVQRVRYASGAIEYQTFDNASTEMLRLTFRPTAVLSGGAPLSLQDILKEDSYTVRDLPGGDYEVRVRHTRSNQMKIRH